jgi:hypothetical protein
MLTPCSIVGTSILRGTPAVAIFNLLEIFVLLGYYAALSGGSVSTFRDNLSVPTSKVKTLDNLTTFICRLS